MRIVFTLLIFLMTALSLPLEQGHAQLPSLGNGSTSSHIQPHIEAETLRPGAGETVPIAIVMKPEPGWHGYWENPGDAGKPLELEWALPEGVSIGELRYPVPHTLVFSGLMNHIYEARYAVLTSVTLPQGLETGTRVPLRARANWLACTDTICVPEHGELSYDFVVGETGGPGLENRAKFDEYRRKLPRPLGAPATYEAKANGDIAILIPYPAKAALSDPHFFALGTQAKSYATPQTYAREGDRLFVALHGYRVDDNGLRGILRIGPDQGIWIDAQPGKVAMPPVSPKAGGAPGPSIWSLIILPLAGAIAGGLLLNIMPCVFPILSVKAMSLLRSHASPAHARAEAWAYAAGIITTCLLLGGGLLALRAAGETVGWAFQLQSPLVILALLALCVAIALNLAGAFALRPMSIDGTAMTRPGLSGDFWSGVLVAFVATPCTGPFMAAALGAALVLPLASALAIFAGLGLGIALPFLLLAHVPALRRLLPRPGPWMERVQRWLSLPMFLTAGALLWLLWRQASVNGLVVGAVVALITGLSLWWMGRRQADDGKVAGAHGAVRMAIAACALALAGGMAQLYFNPQAAAGSSHAANAFSETRLAELRQAGKPVFLYFTADWCLTCKVNEAGAIERDEVQAAFREAGVQVLAGDWTNGDPDITHFLERHGRSGVPLYLWYAPGSGEARELPQILTPTMLMELVKATP